MTILLTRSMLLGSLLWFGACVSAADSDVDSTSQAADTCAAVHIITTRASTEAPGEGITGALVDEIISTSNQTITRAAVGYPATLSDYSSSSRQGITALTNLLTTQVQNCPDQKIVLLGYSQGAHVTLDVLGGGQGGTLGTATPPIASTIGSHVTAVATFGDPRHVVNQPYNRGTSLRNGIFPRSSTQLQVLLGYASRIVTFCDAFDTFCSDGFSLTVHNTYLDRYLDDAAAFVLGKIGG